MTTSADPDPQTAEVDEDELRERFREAMSKPWVYTVLSYGSGPKEVRTEWGVAYGGEDGNDCAGVLACGDEAEAAEMVQWVNGGFLVHCEVAVGPWVRVDGTEKVAPHGDGLAEAQAAFLAASIAVWQEIDRLDAGPGGYHPTRMSAELRQREREAWSRYRDALYGTEQEAASDG